MSEANEVLRVLSRNLNRTDCGDAPEIEIRLVGDEIMGKERHKPIVCEEMPTEVGKFLRGEIVKFFREMTGQKLLSGIHRAGDDAEFAGCKCEVAPADFIGNRGAERCIQRLLRQSIRLVGKQKRQSG